MDEADVCLYLFTSSAFYYLAANYIYILRDIAYRFQKIIDKIIIK